MNPLSLYVLIVSTSAGEQSGDRAIIDTDPKKLIELGERLVADKPAEAQVSFAVVTAEGLPWSGVLEPLSVS